MLIRVNSKREFKFIINREFAEQLSPRRAELFPQQSALLSHNSPESPAFQKSKSCLMRMLAPRMSNQYRPVFFCQPRRDPELDGAQSVTPDRFRKKHRLDCQ